MSVFLLCGRKFTSALTAQFLMFHCLANAFCQIGLLEQQTAVLLFSRKETTVSRICKLTSISDLESKWGVRFRGFSTTFFSCVLFISLRREQWRRSGGCARNISLLGGQWSLVEKVAQSKKGHRYTMSRIIVPYGGISLCWDEESV